MDKIRKQSNKVAPKKQGKPLRKIPIENDKCSAELIAANKELAFQNSEKAKRVAELVIANEEKAKRAAELVIANKELAFQNSEKAKRAAELVIANKELAFQNSEKAKRVAELVIANEEKAKRIAELVIANKQKAKRAAELVIANKQKAKRATERAIAEKELAVLLKNMISAIVVYESVFDEDGKYISYKFGYFNKAYQKITGLTQEEVRGKDVYDVWPGTEASWLEAYGEVAVTGVAKVFDMYHEPTKGWYHCNAYRPSKSPEQICVAFEDITEQKNVWEQLQASETRYRRLFETAKDGIIILDVNTGKIDDVNPFLIKLLGYSKEAFMQKKIWEIGSFKDIIPNKENFTELQKQKYIRYEDMPLQTSKGETIEVEFVSNVYSEDHKDVIQCNIRDVTERIKSEKIIARLASFPLLNTDPIIELNIDGNINYSNAAAQYLFPDLEAMGIRHPFLAGWKASVEQLLAQEADTIAREIIVGDCYYLQTVYYIKSLAVFRIYSHNITKLKAAELALKESEQKYSSYIENAPDGVFITDEKGQFIEANKAAEEITGYSKEELLTMNTSDLLLGKYKTACKRHIMNVLKSGSAKGEFQYQQKSGIIKWWNISSTKLLATRIICFGKDVTIRKTAEDKLMHQNYHDSLTGIYNRRFFEEELRRLDTDRNLPLSLLMADVNGLKFINDSFGHATGDTVLTKTAEVIRKTCRGDDIVARLGGDEFVIILPKTDPSKTRQIVNRIESRASKEKIAGVKLSISIGYDTKDNSEQNISDILENAENHMYTHKIFERASMRSEAIDIVMNTLFEKSSRESLHSKRVSKLCESIAVKMNLDMDDVKQIRIAGLIHDIGKIGIEDTVLNKSEKLNDHEWEEIRKHPEAGWRILSSIKEFAKLAQFIHEHHEKWDGTGYPKGLKGEAISLEARIIAIADAYDAMTSNRSYKTALSKADAIAEINRCSGTHFDPQIVDVFVTAVLAK